MNLPTANQPLLTFLQTILKNDLFVLIFKIFLTIYQKKKKKNNVEM